MTFVFLLVIGLFVLAGCGPRGLRRIFTVPKTFFTANTQHDGMLVNARICKHAELQKFFSSAQDLYHYYHLLHVRLENQSYVRYTLQTEHCSFFVPSSQTLKEYTRSHRSGYGVAMSLFSSVLFFPIYVISMLKAAVESPPYLLEPDMVVPRPFGLLSLLYGVVSLGPFFVGTIAEKSASEKYFAEANKLILTQRRQLSIPPYKTVDTLILTPRSGFSTPCQLGVYNHKSHELEKVTLSVKPVW